MQEELLKGKYKRKSIRLEGFDYGSDGAYLITLCSYNRNHSFSEIMNGEIKLSAIGKIIDEELQNTKMRRKYATVVERIIMPNHVHCIIFIHKHSEEPEHLSPKGSYLYFPEGYKNSFGPQRENLASIIRGIKSAVSTRVKKQGMKSPVWQTNYYEHIIRNEIELEKYILYIKQNPFAWEDREGYPDNR
jgi:REP element-mobilizing transposase RayT